MKNLLLFLLVVFMLIPAGNVYAGGFTDINAILDYLKYDTNWMGAYERGVWDCSNMAACLTWFLSDYETRIVEGKSLFPLGGIELLDGTVVEYVRHAKVKVLIGDRWYWIEPTSLTIDVNAPKEYQVEREFKTRQEAFISCAKRFGVKEAKEEYGYNEKYMKNHVWVKPTENNSRRDWPTWLR